MGRYKPGISDEDRAKSDEYSDNIWQVALRLMAEETAHNVICADPDCGGIIYPWMAANLTRDSAVAFAAIVLERFADMVTGANLGLPPVGVPDGPED